MEFIKAEEFLKQPIEVQKVFTDWWKNNIQKYDLFYRKLNDNRQKYVVTKANACDISTITLRSSNEQIDIEDWDIEFIESIIPLLVEGQMRRFIEDKTHQITIIEFDDGHYNIVQRLGKAYITDQKELLKAYWQVALGIAKECVENGRA